MKKVNYFNEVGNSEAMGMDPLSLGPIEGEFLGIIKEDGEDYLITRTTLAFNDDPEYLGKITARHVIAEYAPGHMAKIYIDMDTDNKTMAIEEALNKSEAESQKKITEKIMSETKVNNRKYNDVINEASTTLSNPDEKEFKVLAIEHDIFKKKQENIQKLENGEAYNSGRNY